MLDIAGALPRESRDFVSLRPSFEVAMGLLKPGMDKGLPDDGRKRKEDG